MEIVREEPIAKTETAGWRGLLHRLVTFTVVEALVICIPVACAFVWLRQYRAFRAKLKRS